MSDEPGGWLDYDEARIAGLAISGHRWCASHPRGRRWTPQDRVEEAFCREKRPAPNVNWRRGRGRVRRTKREVSWLNDGSCISRERFFKSNMTLTSPPCCVMSYSNSTHYEQTSTELRALIVMRVP